MKFTVEFIGGDLPSIEITAKSPLQAFRKIDAIICTTKLPAELNRVYVFMHLRNIVKFHAITFHAFSFFNKVHYDES